MITHDEPFSNSLGFMLDAELGEDVAPKSKVDPGPTNIPKPNALGEAYEMHNHLLKQGFTHESSEQRVKPHGRIYRTYSHPKGHKAELSHTAEGLVPAYTIIPKHSMREGLSSKDMMKHTKDL
jgi:hypothetical protein